MIELCHVPHFKIDSDELEKIAILKQERWPHSIKEQLNWMSINLHAEDFHILLKVDNKLLSYMNLVRLKINGKSNVTEEAFGMGSVCTSKASEGNGLGKIITAFALHLSKSESKNCVLLCKKQLIKFYETSGFKRFEGKVTICGEAYEHEFMTAISIDSKFLNLNKSF
jgi:predicted GNAT family N-acyltransferase